MPAPADPAAAAGNPEAQGLLRLGDRLAGHNDFATAEISYRQVLARADFPIADQKTALLDLAHTLTNGGSSAPSGSPSLPSVGDVNNGLGQILHDIIDPITGQTQAPKTP